MRVLSKMSGVFAAFVLSATSAAAVTVTFKSTIESDFARVSPPNVKVGDAVTFTFDIDPNQALTSTNLDRDPGGPVFYNDPRYYPLTNALSVTGDYGTYFTRSITPEFLSASGAFGNVSNITATFEKSGKTIDLGRGTFGLGLEVLDSSMVPAGTKLYGRELVLDTAQGHGFDFHWQSDVAFDFSLDSMLREIGDAESGRAWFYVTQADIGGTFFADQGLAQIRLVEGQATSTFGTGSNPPTDTNKITPVPVPAPFMMLGAAMLGLIRFGRTRRI